jgi:hypothetical protein
MSTADPNVVIVTGENPFIRLSPTDSDDYTTNASFWRIIFSPAGPGHVLYLKSELTEKRWRIWSDNIAMARWLQTTVQGMLNAELLDTTIPVTDAEFSSQASALFLDRASSGARRRSPSPGTTSTSAAHSHAAKAVPAALRRMHGARACPWRPPVAQRHPGRGQAVETGAGGQAVQHQRAGVSES